MHNTNAMDLQEALAEVERLKTELATRPAGPKPCVVGLVTDMSGERIALIRHRIRGKWELPGGKIKDDDATWQAALLRELKEEIGVTVTLADPCLIDVLNGPPVSSAEYRSVMMVGLGTTTEVLVPGSDAVDAGFFTADRIPWSDMSPLTSVEIVERWAHERLSPSLPAPLRPIQAALNHVRLRVPESVWIGLSAVILGAAREFRADRVGKKVAHLHDVIVAANNALVDVCRGDHEHQIECHAVTLPDEHRRVATAVEKALEILRPVVADMVEPEAEDAPGITPENAPNPIDMWADYCTKNGSMHALVRRGFILGVNAERERDDGRVVEGASTARMERMERLERAINAQRAWLMNDDPTAPIPEMHEVVEAYGAWKSAGAVMVERSESKPCPEPCAGECQCKGPNQDATPTTLSREEALEKLRAQDVSAWAADEFVTAPRDHIAFKGTPEPIKVILRAHVAWLDANIAKGRPDLNEPDKPGHEWKYDEQCSEWHQVPVKEATPHCPKCGRTESVTRWTDEQKGTAFYVCSTSPPGNGCGHSFSAPDASAPPAVSDGDWRPTVGARVQTAEGLKASPPFGHEESYDIVSRRPNAAGEVRADLGGGTFRVRHEDGSEAPYHADELQPAPKENH